MKYLGKPFIQDQSGMFYLDTKDTVITPFNFHEVNGAYGYSKQRVFFHIDGVDDYIVKDTSRLPRFFNESRNKKLIKNLTERQDKFDDIDFPVAYCMEDDKMIGTVVPYYEKSVSIRKLIKIYEFDELKKYYMHDDDEIVNLVKMCLEVLDIIEKLYAENIVYTDINTGNFLVYNNSVKLVDFEPDYVHFTKHRNRYYKILLSNYNLLINSIWHNYKFNKAYYHPGESFSDARDRVKLLCREKRG